MRRVRSWSAWMVAAGVGAAWVVPSTTVHPDPVLRTLVERLTAAGSLVIEGRAVEASPVVLEMYRLREFEPLWAPAELEALLHAIRATAADGLDPELYHAASLTGLTLLPITPDRGAALDVLATDAFIRLTQDLRFGRTPPIDAVAEFTGAPEADADSDPFGTTDAAETLLDVVASGHLEQHLAELRPAHVEYDQLIRGLAELRAIAHRGGWEPIPNGPTMQRDHADPRIALLRSRLIVSGDHREEGQGAADPDLMHFDDALERAVRHFQHRHGLNEDGRVGEATLASLNVPVETRIEQIRVNLEQMRRAERDRPPEYVSVNVAGARVYMTRHGAIDFETRAVVGEMETQTPSFDALMTYIELNPTWTVPRGMVGEMLAAVRADPNYLEERDMRLLRADGTTADATDVDFLAFTAKTFPYVFHQAPGPLNPLGRIKLIFPNEYAVYLHDSPARWAFAEEERLYSHGCVRVEDPIGLAVQALDDPETWTREAIEEAIAEGATRAIPLTTPLSVYVVYRTVEADRAGILHFYDDVYERDPPVLAVLDAPR